MCECKRQKWEDTQNVTKAIENVIVLLCFLQKNATSKILRKKSNFFLLSEDNFKALLIMNKTIRHVPRFFFS